MRNNLLKKLKAISGIELDENIVGLVRAINEFKGIYTVGSCGGHSNNENFQMPEGEWMVIFQVEFNEKGVSPEGWVALEFLVWACNNNFARSGYDVNISTFSSPPYLNQIGGSISFTIKGRGISADTFAEELRALRKECFVSL